MFKFINKNKKFKVSHPYKNLIASLGLGFVVFFAGIASAITGFFGLNTQIKSYALTGIGTSSSPYQVSTSQELVEAMKKTGAYIDITKDIVVSGSTTFGSFSGRLNGNNHVITLRAPFVENNSGYIQNAKFKLNSNARTFTANSGAEFSSLVVNGTNSGNLNNLEIISSFNYVNVNSEKFGGFAKINTGSIEKVINNQSFINDKDNSMGTAGIVAENKKTILNAVNFGNIRVSGNITREQANGNLGVAGGLVGVMFNGATISNSYNMGDIYAANASNPTTQRKGFNGGHAGGLVGLSINQNSGNQLLSYVVNYGDVFGGNGSKGADGQAGIIKEYKNSDSNDAKPGVGGKGGYGGGNGGNAGAIVGSKSSNTSTLNINNNINFGLISPGFGGDGGNGGGGSGAGFKYSYSTNGSTIKKMDYSPQSGNGQVGGNGMVLDVASEVGVTVYGSGGGGAGGRAGAFGLSSESVNNYTSNSASNGVNGGNGTLGAGGSGGGSGKLAGVAGTKNSVTTANSATRRFNMFASAGGNGGNGEKILDVLSNGTSKRVVINRKSLNSSEQNGFSSFNKNSLNGWVKIGDRYELVFEDSERDITLKLNFTLDGVALNSGAGNYIRIQTEKNGIKKEINLTSQSNKTISSKDKLIFSNKNNHAFSVVNGSIVVIERDNNGLISQVTKDLEFNVNDYLLGEITLNINLFSGLSGEGTQLKPFKIGNEKDLELLNLYLGKKYYFEITNSFTVSSNNHQVLSQNFDGVLEANNHTITLGGLAKTLFTENTGTIENLNIVVSNGNKNFTNNAVSGFVANKNSGIINNVSINSQGKVVVSSNQGFGLLVGENSGTIDNITIKGNFEFAVSNQTSGNNINVAGVVAINTNSINNIKNSATLTLSNQADSKFVVFGGMVAKNNTTQAQENLVFGGSLTIENSNQNTTIGLLIGETNSDLRYSYSYGEITFNSNQANSKLGLLIGKTTSNVKLTQVYSNAQVTENGNLQTVLLVAEGVVNYNGAVVLTNSVRGTENSQVTKLTSAEMLNLGSFVGFDFLNIWYANQNSTPSLFAYNESKLTVSVEFNNLDKYSAQAFIPVLNAENNEYISFDSNGVIYIDTNRITQDEDNSGYNIFFKPENESASYITVDLIENNQTVVIADKESKQTFVGVALNNLTSSSAKLVITAHEYEYAVVINDSELTNGERVSNNDIGNFTYKVNGEFVGQLTNIVENLKLGDNLTIIYNDPTVKTLRKVSATNKLYFNGIKYNGEFISGNVSENSVEFDINISDESATKGANPAAYTPIFEEMVNVSIKAIYENDAEKLEFENTAFINYEGAKYASVNAVEGVLLNLTTENDIVDNEQDRRFSFAGFKNENGESIGNNGSTAMQFVVGNQNVIIIATYTSGQRLVRISLTEQDNIYNEQPVSFNGIVLNYNKNNFSQQDIITNPTNNFYLEAGQYTVTLITGRAGGLIESPGLFLLSEHYSELPYGATINGATTAPVNGQERNRFNEINNNYVNINGENYSQINFTVVGESASVIDIKLSFVPVYAYNENSLNATDNIFGSLDFEVGNIADFGTMTEMLNYTDHRDRHLINWYAKFNQVADIKAEYNFGNLGNQAVFVRPVAVLGSVSGLTYDGGNHKIEDANIFIGLQHDGGDFAIFAEGEITVSNLVVNNTTIVRGTEINSTINETVMVKRYSDDTDNGRYEYKLKIGGVSSGTRFISNVIANNLTVNFGPLVYVDENGNITEKEVIAYVGGIAGATAIYTVYVPINDFNPNIKESLFTGDINLTNVKGIIGGVAGLNVSVISNSKSEANIVSSGYIGGLVGENRGVLSSSTFSGNIKGYGIVGGAVALNNTMLIKSGTVHSPRYSLTNSISSIILNGSVEVLGASQNQIPIWDYNNQEKTYNNYGAGFIGVSDVTVFAGSYSNTENTIIKGERVSPFIGLLTNQYQTQSSFIIADNYFVGYENTINPNMKVMGYKENGEFSIEFTNTFVKINNNLIYSSVANNQNLLESFLENVSYSSYQRDTNFEITNREKFEEMIGGQNIDYPYLTEGYGNYLYTHDRVGVSFYQLTNSYMYPEYNLSRNWEINPHYKTYDPLVERYNSAIGAAHIEFWIIKFTKIVIDINRLFDNNEIYYLTNYHRTYALGDGNSAINPVVVDNSDLHANSTIKTGSNQQSFTLEFNSDTDIINESVAHEIILQFADSSTLDLNINNHNYIQNYKVYDVGGDLQTHERFNYYLNKNFSLNSVNKSMLTTEVEVKVQTLDLVDFQTVNISSNTYKFDLNNAEEFFEKLVGLDIEIIKHYNTDGYEVLDFNLDIKGAYRIEISTKSSIRIALSITGVDEELRGYVSDVVYTDNRNNNNFGDEILPISSAENLNRVIVEIPIINETGRELTGIGILTNIDSPGQRYEMVPEFITVNGIRVAENEFDLDLNQDIFDATHYVNQSLGININLQDYFVEGSDRQAELKNSHVAIDINTHFDYAVHELYINSLDNQIDNDNHNQPIKAINYNLELNKNKTIEYDESNPNTKFYEGYAERSRYHKNHKDGATIRLLNLENPAPYYPNYTFPNDIYKIIGEDRLVRIQIMASPIYSSYNEFVLQEGRNPNEFDTDVILTGDLTLNTGPMTDRLYYISINAYEVYELEIKTDLTEDSLGISKGITPDIMPIANIAGNLNNAVEFRTATNEVPRINSYAQLSSMVYDDNSTRMLIEHGAKLNLTSNKNNIVDQIDHDRLLFDSWAVYGGNPERNSDINEGEIFETRPVVGARTVVAEYKVRTVRVYYNIDANYSSESDNHDRGLLLPEIRSANPSIQYEKVLYRNATNDLLTKYVVGDRAVIKINPQVFLEYRNAPKLPFNESGITEVNYRGYIVKDNFRIIEVAYGEELEFVPKDYSQSPDSRINIIKQGPFQLFTFNQQPGHEDYLTDISESMPDNPNNNFALLDGETDWFSTNTQSDLPRIFKGQALGDFIVSSKVLTRREVNIGYYYNSSGRVRGNNNISSYSDPILTGNNNFELPYQIVNAWSLYTYNYSNVEIKFNISQIEKDHGITANELYWDLQMPQNYLGGPDEYYDGLYGNGNATTTVPYKLNHEDNKTTTIDYITYKTFNEVIDGDTYAVIRFTLNIIDGIISTNVHSPWSISHYWSARVEDLMVVNLRINQGTV